MISKNMSYNLEFLDRLFMMLDAGQQEKLLSSRVIIFGCGGVGSAVAHMLTRSGIQHLGIVDFDNIDITNINRQLVAYQDNVGKSKVEELEKQLKNINTNLKIDKYFLKYGEETINNIDLSQYDYIVDCIDDLSAKKLLIKQTIALNKPILCAMGAGNRYLEIPQFEIADISKTSYDPIAKILRKFCKEERINKLTVCYTKQKALKFDCNKIASVVYYVVNMASVMCSKIINDLIK